MFGKGGGEWGGDMGVSGRSTAAVSHATGGPPTAVGPGVDPASDRARILRPLRPRRAPGLRSPGLRRRRRRALCRVAAARLRRGEVAAAARRRFRPHAQAPRRHWALRATAAGAGANRRPGPAVPGAAQRAAVRETPLSGVFVSCVRMARGFLVCARTASYVGLHACTCPRVHLPITAP